MGEGVVVLGDFNTCLKCFGCSCFFTSFTIRETVQVTSPRRLLMDEEMDDVIKWEK